MESLYYTNYLEIAYDKITKAGGNIVRGQGRPVYKDISVAEEYLKEGEAVFEFTCDDKIVEWENDDSNIGKLVSSVLIERKANGG